MRTLRVGLIGDDVKAWQLFLRGKKQDSKIIVTGVYDVLTKDETEQFQKLHGLTIDGKVGQQTLGKAMMVGYGVEHSDDDIDKDGPGWPARPNFEMMSDEERHKQFGDFKYIETHSPGNPEGIKIIDNWDTENIVTITIPQLQTVTKISNSCNVKFHKKCSKQLVKVFSDWEKADLLDKVITWNGSFVPRFKRGSRTDLSNHSWGTAFDINVKWNGLGQQPALRGEKGSVRELVEIAYENGFGWGGWYKKRPDGMHFEIVRIID